MFTEIHCWNVLRGESTLIKFPRYSRVHVVDFGTAVNYMSTTSSAIPSCNDLKNYRLRRACLEAYAMIRMNKTIEVFVTHLHFDHYSLIPFILGQHQISRLFLPAIPRPKEIADYTLKLIAYEYVFLKLSGRDVWSLLTRNMKSGGAYLLVRGNKVDILGNNAYVKVLWPPSSLEVKVAEKVRRRLKQAHSVIEEFASKIGVEPFAEEISHILKETMVANSEFESESRQLSEHIYKRIGFLLENMSEKFSITKRSLTLKKQLEKKLSMIKDATNDMSLVLKYYYMGMPFALVLGDNSETVLNYLARLEKTGWTDRNLVFLRAAHHGTYYGEFIKKHRAQVQWLSWTKNMRKNLKTDYFWNAPITCLADREEELHINSILHTYLRKTSVFLTNISCDDVRLFSFP